MIKTFFKKHWLIILILLLSAFFRLYKIGSYMEWLGDQGRDLIIIRDFLKHGNLFFIGPVTSIGNMYLGPFYYYLIAPSLLLANFNPIGPSIFVALLGILTVFLIYKISQKWFGQKVALIASLLYAISPLVIKYSNFSWNPNIMPLFALLFIYFIVESKWFFASLCFIMAINSHYLALVLLPIAAIYWGLDFFKNKKLNKQKFIKNTIIAITIFTISLIPQILFDIKHDNQNAKAITKFFTQRETTVNIKIYKSLTKIPLLFNQINTDLIFGKNTQFAPYLSAIFALLIIYLIYYFFKNKKDKTTKYAKLVGIWLLIGVGGLGLYKQHIYSHYFGFLFPVVFMVTALCISKTKYIGYCFLAILIFLSLKENPLRYQPNNQLGVTREIVNNIIKDSDNKPFNFSLLAKMNYADPYLYFFENSKLVDTHNQVTDQLYVVCEPFQIDCNPINNPEWGIASFGWAKIDKQWKKNDITIFKLIHPDDKK